MTRRHLALYHADWDGLVSVWVVRTWSHVEAEWTLIPVQYGDPIPASLEGYHQVFVLDFSYSREILAQLAAANDHLVLIDHHKTAIEQLAKGAWPANSTVVLESDRAGRQVAACELVWEYIWSARGQVASEAPALVRYAADRDTWAFALPYSREVSAYAQACDQTLDACRDLDCLLRLGPQGVGLVASQGDAILRYQRGIVARAVEAARAIRLPLRADNGPTRMAVGFGAEMPIGTLISDVAGELAQCEVAGEPVNFGCCWFRRANAWVYSLRSRSDFDCSELARGLGGGGHPQAAGFTSATAPWDWPAQ